jgi:hypothetical protein
MCYLNSVRLGDQIAKNLGLPLHKIQKSKLQHIFISDTLRDELDNSKIKPQVVLRYLQKQWKI